MKQTKIRTCLYKSNNPQNCNIKIIKTINTVLSVSVSVQNYTNKQVCEQSRGPRIQFGVLLIYLFFYGGLHFVSSVDLGIFTLKSNMCLDLLDLLNLPNQLHNKTVPCIIEIMGVKHDRKHWIMGQEECSAKSFIKIIF